MTNGNETGGTALVNPNHRALRSSSKSNSGGAGGGSSSSADQHAVEVALMNEEEKMIDEEVTSVEDNHCEEEGASETTSIEQTMMTVALVKSVVENTTRQTPSSAVGEQGASDGGGGGVGSSSESNANVGTSGGNKQTDGGDGSSSPGGSGGGGSEGNRYGLRKRRRPSGQGLARLEHFQSSKAGGLAKTVPRAPKRQQQQAVKEKQPKVEPSLEVRAAPLATAGTVAAAPDPVTVIANPPLSTASLRLAIAPAAPPVQRPAVVRQQPKAAPTQRRVAAAAAAPVAPVAPPPPEPTVSVPPALQISSVPNPLLKTTMHLGDPSLRHMSIDSNSALPEPPAVASVPCPLPATSNAGLESAKSPPTTTAAAVSSLDTDKRKQVTISEQSSGVRVRGFSIDMDLALDFADDPSASVSAALPAAPDTALTAGGGGAGGRDRAFSFECFAFGINADEPLPPLEQSASHVQSTSGRPRGDSIIFDPSSFQDGGIHEQSALNRCRAPSVEAAPSTATAVAAPPKPARPVVAAPPPPVSAVPVVSSSSQPRPAAAAAASAARPTTKTTTTYQPSSIHSNMTIMSGRPSVVTSVTPSVTASSGATVTSTSMTAASHPGANVSPTLSLELINKDGRIGIYLPEARRQRIARFHAKRAKRIWRKRIKYDCRKKLADSRPRIKGRFVKRSDMEDE